MIIPLSLSLSKSTSFVPQLSVSKKGVPVDILQILWSIVDCAREDVLPIHIPVLKEVEKMNIQWLCNVLVMLDVWCTLKSGDFEHHLF